MILQSLRAVLRSAKACFVGVAQVPGVEPQAKSAIRRIEADVIRGRAATSERFLAYNT